MVCCPGPAHLPVSPRGSESRVWEAAKGGSMGAPATTDEFLGLVRKSGIIDDKRLAAYVEKDRSASLPNQPKELAQRLVRDGLLTGFQAEQFLQGKWRRFT